MTAPSGAARSAAGFALIVVLWFLVLISAIAIYLMVGARSETAIARNVKAAAAAEALADAGVYEAVFNQTDPAVANRWKLDGAQHLVTLPTGSLTIRVTDETQKVNPNFASAALLAGLFEAVGVDRGLAQHLGDSTADWVSAGDNPRRFGAKRDQYVAAGRTYGPPNAPIDSLDELLLVLGMTPDIFARARPYLTIYTDDAAPDAKNASSIVRNALRLAARAPAEAAGEAPRAEGEAQQRESETDQPNSGGENSPESTNAPPGQPEEVLELDVTAESTDGAVFVRHAVVRLDPDSAKGFVVLDWQRGELAAAEDLSGG